MNDNNNNNNGNYSAIEASSSNISNNSNNTNNTNPRHDRLRRRPVLWAAVGVAQTLLSAGVIFGWASLLPVLRDELSHNDEETTTTTHYSAQDFTTVFTIGAVGNYLSTLFFGIILDRHGPRATGVLASLLFALGLVGTSYFQYKASLIMGFCLLGFAGPGIQMPTLHLANLFNSSPDGGPPREGGSGGAAWFMSAQAAAFDGGTAVFAIFRLLHQSLNVSAAVALRCYLLVPLWCLVTSLWIWPDEILENDNDDDENLTLLEDDNHHRPVVATPDLHRNNPLRLSERSYVGPTGSPYMLASPGRVKKLQTQGRRERNHVNLVNAPLSVILRHSAFWSLALWVSIHILKLNFIVATINDQLELALTSSSSLASAEEERGHLIDVFGAMLPFGFVVLPLVASILDKSAVGALQLANVVGLLYGGVMVFFPGSKWLQMLVTFPSVACSRQLVYSTIFHQIGQLFGFANYGVLLGLTNLCVSSLSMVQTPLVSWSESMEPPSYLAANWLLWIVTMPLLVVAFWADPSSSSNGGGSSGMGPIKMKKNPLDDDEDDENSALIKAAASPRGSAAGILLSV